MSQHYLPGFVCGYLTVQTGGQRDAKRKKMFIVLSDSRMDFYTLDPRPEFEIPVTETYMFRPITHVNHYVELNSNAPPLSFCLTTDKSTRVFIADSQQDMETWFEGIKDRLDALTTMLTGKLMLRKEVPVDKQVTRFLLSSKYKWKMRYVELGRGSIRYFKNVQQSQSAAKIMKQFPLTSTSYVVEEEMEQLERLVHDQSTAVAKSPRKGGGASSNQQLSYSERIQREQSSFFPFTICTGPTHLVLAAQTRSARSEWVLAIRLRIVGLKYRGPNGLANPNSGKVGSEVQGIQLQQFMEVQKTRSIKWKKRFVELENGMLKVKASERKVGALIEMPLIPTCIVAPALVRANAFSVRNLGQLVVIAATSAKDADHWMNCIKKVATGVEASRYEKIFEEEARHILTHSKYHEVIVQTAGKAGLVLEKYQKRVFVLSHDPEAAYTHSASPASGSAPTPAMATAASIKNPRVPEGSVLINLCEHDIDYDTFENIWHNVRQRKGRIRPMKLTFRAPIERTGILEIKIRLKDDWRLHRIILANGKVRFEPYKEDDLPIDNAEEAFVFELPLRLTTVELMNSEEYGASNCMRISTQEYPPVLVNACSDDDLYLWFVLLHLEICIAKVDVRFPIPPKRPSSTLTKLTKSRNPQIAARPYSKCLVRGKSIAAIERNADSCADRLVQDKKKRCSVTVEQITPQLAASGETSLPASEQPSQTQSEKPTKQQDAVETPTTPKKEQLQTAEVVTSAAGGELNSPVRRSSAGRRRSSVSVPPKEALSVKHPPIPLTENELKSLFQLLDFAECGKVSSLLCSTTMESLTRHLMPDCMFVLASFHSELQSLRPVRSTSQPNLQASERNFLIRENEFNQLMRSTIHDFYVLEVLRKFIHAQIQTL